MSNKEKSLTAKEHQEPENNSQNRFLINTQNYPLKFDQNVNSGPD